jgi:hypothetical protein
MGPGDYGAYFTGFEGVRGVAYGSNGYGVWGTAYGSRSYGGYFTGYYGAYGYSSSTQRSGVYGRSGGGGGDGVTALATNTSGYGLDTQATGSYGYAGRFLSNRYHGIFVNGSYSSGSSYDGYFYNCIRVGGTVYGSCSSSADAALTSILALNDGDLALEPGDLVAFSGFVTSADGSGPTLAVQKVNGANSPAIIGVVQSAYAQEAPVEMQAQMQAQLTPAGAAPAAAAVEPQKEDPPLPEVEFKEEAGEEPPPPLPEGAIEIEPEVVPELDTSSVPQAEAFGGDAGHFVEGAAQPGQYVVVAIQGITRVKVDASAAPVRAGDMLTASATGYAINATTAPQPDGASQPREGAGESGDRERTPLQILTLGRALEPLESGTGAIYVFVSVR